MSGFPAESPAEVEIPFDLGALSPRALQGLAAICAVIGEALRSGEAPAADDERGLALEVILTAVETENRMRSWRLVTAHVRCVRIPLPEVGRLDFLATLAKALQGARDATAATETVTADDRAKAELVNLWGAAAEAVRIRLADCAEAASTARVAAARRS